MRELVFFLEEESAKFMLQGLWPRLAPSDREIRPIFIVFDGKQDLEKQLPRKLSRYLNPEAGFIVLRDQDSGDCAPIKRRLVGICETHCRSRPFLVRIACRELESWYLAQFTAVEQGLGVKGLSKQQEKRKYRDPDRLGNASGELERLTHGLYEKRMGSRSIAPHLDPDCTRSTSFKHFISAIRKLSLQVKEPQ